MLTGLLTIAFAIGCEPGPTAQVPVAKTSTLDSAAKSAVPIDATELTINFKIADQPKQFALAAAPQADESDGKSSRFRLACKELLEVLHGEVAAKISLQINGKPYSGTVPHEDHTGHDHKH